MNVEIKILPENCDGLVATGTFLLDAARRLGVEVTTECGGKGECDTCAMFIESGASLMSSLTVAETTQLTPERLAGGERLSCQAKLEVAGDIVVRHVTVEEVSEPKREFQKDFNDLPLGRKLTTLAEMEAVTAFEALNAVLDLPFKAFGLLMDVAAKKGRELHERDLLRRRATNEITTHDEDIKN